ncbi:MAG: glutathione S-transferase family protein [Alphaproteobacteria bacterium]|nr:glutathione S-transferase family protein [Alphaproteobacteria bacterium]
MKFYNADFSPNCLRVRAVANELGIEMDIVDVDLRKGAPDDMKALNANGKVPVLDDNGFGLWESRAITAYLAGKDPAKRLYPDDVVTRALIDQWSYWQAIHLGPAMQKVAFERVMKKKFGMGEPDESKIVDSLAETEKFLKVFDSGLGDRDWIAGDLSIADFALASTFMFRDAANVSLAAASRVTAWIGRMESRESWKRAVAPVMALVAA